MARGPYVSNEERTAILTDWLSGRFRAEDLAMKYGRCIGTIRDVTNGTPKPGVAPLKPDTLAGRDQRTHKADLGKHTSEAA